MNWETYGGKFVSKKLNNGEFDYWMVMEIINWREHSNDPLYTYNVGLSMVAPSQLDRDTIDRAFESWGLVDYLDTDPLLLIDIVSSYGAGVVPLWDESGDNLRKLMKQARHEADHAEMLLGFYLDRQVNALGATGWDWLEGDLMGRAFKEVT
jgi:hypothetical protein